MYPDCKKVQREKLLTVYLECCKALNRSPKVKNLEELHTSFTCVNIKGISLNCGDLLISDELQQGWFLSYSYFYIKLQLSILGCNKSERFRWMTPEYFDTLI